jgi:hypothetical protein
MEKKGKKKEFQNKQTHPNAKHLILFAILNFWQKSRRLRSQHYFFSLTSDSKN